MRRRPFLAGLAAAPLAAVAKPAGFGIGRIVLRAPAGAPAAFDLSGLVPGHVPGTTRLRLRADAGDGASVAFESQYPEVRFDDPVLHHDGAGAASARLRIEATDATFDDRGAVVVSDVAYLSVTSPLARIRHGLDEWPSFDALTRAVRGDAPRGAPPSGRVDLIGKTFDVTPGMISEPEVDAALPPRAPRAAATIQFPCTVRALDPRQPPVLRATSGERDVVRIEAVDCAPLDGEVVLQDLTIRDNRGWYDTGEAGVRIRDRFAGRSVRIERCEFVRCQNAVAGGALGQRLRIHDCRIVDCGFGTQAHALYVQPEWLEFFGNLVVQSAGNRLARAHLLKTRALNARILGNRFLMNDCPGSFVIDVPNGGDCEIGGNAFQYGPLSDNASATFVAWAAEGAGADFGPPPYAFSPGRRFALVARNNTFVSGFPGTSAGFVIDRRQGPRAEGGVATTRPDPLVIADNVFHAAGTVVPVVMRDRVAGIGTEVDASGRFAGNAVLGADGFVGGDPQRFALKREVPNAAGAYAGRRFTGATRLGTGSTEHRHTVRGAS